MWWSSWEISLQRSTYFCLRSWCSFPPVLRKWIHTFLLKRVVCVLNLKKTYKKLNWVPSDSLLFHSSLFTSCLYFQCLGLPFQYLVTPPAVVPLRQFVCLANRVCWRFVFPRALQLCPLCWTPGWTACCRLIWWGSCAGISKGQTKWLICWRYRPSPLWHCLDLAALLVCSGLLCRNQEPPPLLFLVWMIFLTQDLLVWPKPHQSLPDVAACRWFASGQWTSTK